MSHAAFIRRVFTFVKLLSVLFSGLVSVLNIAGGVLALYGYLFPRPMYGNVSDQLVEIVNDVSSPPVEKVWLN